MYIIIGCIILFAYVRDVVAGCVLCFNQCFIDIFCNSLCTNINDNFINNI